MNRNFKRLLNHEHKEINKATPKQVAFIKEYSIHEDIDFDSLTIDEAFVYIKEIEDLWIEIEAECYCEDVGDR